MYFKLKTKIYVVEKKETRYQSKILLLRHVCFFNSYNKINMIKNIHSIRQRDKKMTNAIGWFEIYVQDMDRAKNFYENLFKVKLKQINNKEIDIWAFDMNSKNYGASGALVKMDGAPSGFSGTIVYFMSEDCSIECKIAEKLGGKIFKSKFSIGEHGFIALIYDTEGNMIGLHSRQ